MNRKNNWSKETATQADSYIEKRFEEVCEDLSNGAKILNEWRERKEQYICYTSLIIFDFQHYSRHDVTHSIKILEAIELILGEERVKLLSAGDLWLLLESAYFHDIGMAVTYRDMVQIWESDTFKDYLGSASVQSDLDLRNAKNWYFQMDNLVHNRDKMYRIEEEDEVEFENAWPVELERKLLFLITAYIRKDHAKRCKEYLKRFQENYFGVIPERLYQVVAEIAISHGENFSYVLEKLKKKSQGLGMDYIHPQFIAVLLRLGDLLDMDNNRFNLRALEHYGKIPWSSEIHLRKHKAMTHIMICREQIEAEAEDENLEVCQITSDWFRYIEQEVINLICYWSDFAPKSMQGCLMKKAKCKVYHPKAPNEFRSEWQKRFEVDKGKLTDLMIGINIYDIKLDFLREYLQNAMDASKMQLWLELKRGRYHYLCNPDVPDLRQLAPFDIPQSVYERFAIEVKISLDIKTQKVKFEIVDRGIGMEEACLDVISRIGLGWRGRKAYSDVIPEMPSWLRPTGGFGIGVQSAFMLTDQIELQTKSDMEMKKHILTLNSPRTSGVITEEIDLDVNQTERGTIVKLSVDLDYFQKWNEEIALDSSKSKNNGIEGTTVQKMLNRMEYEGADVFAENDTLDYVIQYVKHYIDEVIANPVIPIRITHPHRKSIEIKSKYFVKEDFWTQQKRYITEKGSFDGNVYRWIFDVDENALIVWNEENATYTYLKRRSDIQRKKHVVCFKNVCVIRNTGFEYPKADELDICIDFMGYYAEQVLKVHRSAFNESFSQKRQIEDAIYIYIRAMMSLKNQLERKADNNDDLQDMSRSLENVHSNLCQSNIPWICLLNNCALEVRSSRKIRVHEYTISARTEDGQKNEAELKEIIKEQDENILLEKVRNILNGGDESIYVFSSAKPDAEMISKINDQILNTMYSSIKTGENDLFIGDNMKIEKAFIEKACAEGIMVVDDINIYRLLVESKMFKTDAFSLSIDKLDKYVVVFSGKKPEESGRLMSENEFYRRAYGVQGRELFAMPDAERYPELMVLRLPYDKPMTGKAPYLISPIDENIRENYRRKTEANRTYRYQKEYSLNEFTKFILTTVEFQALLEWVYRNQIEEKRYRKEKIKEAYKNFVTDIYTKYLHGKKANDDF